MYKNIGRKIMKLAEFLCWAGIILSVAVGIAFVLFGIIMENMPFFVVYGIILVVVGPISSWISSFLLYGFGRLIENSDIIAGRK